MLVAAVSAPSPASPAMSTGSLKQLSVEELMNVEVYSASRHLEPTQTSPSAIYVLTNDDWPTAAPSTIRCSPACCGHPRIS